MRCGRFSFRQKSFAFSAQVIVAMHISVSFSLIPQIDKMKLWKKLNLLELSLFVEHGR